MVKFGIAAFAVIYDLGRFMTEAGIEAIGRLHKTFFYRTSRLSCHFFFVFSLGAAHTNLGMFTNTWVTSLSAYAGNGSPPSAAQDQLYIKSNETASCLKMTQKIPFNYG